MGCILSEVITWVTEGQKKLREYRRRRLDEVDKTISTREDRFHCNGEVLDTVNQLHEELTQNSRRYDYVTTTIVQGLVHSSIVIDHRSRASAHHLSYQSDRILKEAEKKLERGRHHAVSDGVLDTKKRWPPNLPPKSASSSSAGTFEVETENGHLEQLSRHRQWSTDFHGRDTHSEWVQNATGRKPVHNSMSRDGNHNHACSLERSQQAHQQPNLANRRPERVSSQPFSSSVQGRQYVRSSAHKAQLELRSLQNPLGITTDTLENTQAPYSPLRPRQNRHSPTSAGGPAPRPSTTEGISYQPQLRDLDPFVERRVASPELLFETSDTDEESSPRYKPALKYRPHPQMSVKEGLTIKRAKDRGRNAEYPDQALFRTLDAVLKRRDHVCCLANLPSWPLTHSLLARADSHRRFSSTRLRAWNNIGIR